MIALALGLLAVSSTASKQSSTHIVRTVCDVPPVEYVGELHSILSQRAIQAINLAAASDGKLTAELKRLIDPTASFSSGSGDVGLPLASGVAGAMALAREMKADTYRFAVWDGIPTPVEDRCGEEQIEVEFIDTHSDSSFPVTFTFLGGKIVAAKGWRRLFHSGPLRTEQQ
ncbi:hypothetical protein [Novosphingobium huizhouense]|uniref:hypothetical protein n=1 Tax=Novosphingobium huizhouense TaxID=2866625 RepID=UPI001CD88339|nr:hypothetical protein [Novosphingobium huizhouense]